MILNFKARQYMSISTKVLRGQIRRLKQTNLLQQSFVLF